MRQTIVLAAISNVLFAASRRLHHLLMGAGADGDEAVAEYYRSVINDLRPPVGLELLISAVWENELGEVFSVSHSNPLDVNIVWIKYFRL